MLLIRIGDKVYGNYFLGITVFGVFARLLRRAIPVLAVDAARVTGIPAWIAGMTRFLFVLKSQA